MQPFLCFLLGWFALLGLCLGAAGLPRKSHPALSAQVAGVLPLVWLCGAVLLLLGFGLAGHLRLGACLVCGCGVLGWLLFAAVGVRLPRQERRRRFAGVFCPGWLACFGGSLALAAVLALRQPLFTQWDEFSFWGLAAKTVWRNDALYTLVQNTNLAARSYPPALPLLAYLFSFGASAFSPWAVFAAYGFFAFAVFGAVLGCMGAKNMAAAAFGVVALALCPFAVEYHSAGQQLAGYVTAYADGMLGLAAAGCIAVWYALCSPVGAGQPHALPLGKAQRQSRLGAAAATLPVVGFLVCVKDVGLPLALVVALICAADCLIVPAGQRGRPGQALCTAALQCGAALAAYGVWSAHLANALNQNRGETGGSAGLSTFAMVTQGLRELAGIRRSEKFSAVLSAMVQAFFHRRVTAFGTGLTTGAVLCAAVVLAALLLPRGSKGRALSYGVCAGLGYIGYSFFQLICYVYVFSDAEGRQLASYERYMGSYLLFGMVGALCLVCLGTAARPADMDSRLTPVKRQLLSMAAFGLLACRVLTVLPGCCVQLADGQSANAYQQRIERHAQAALALTDTPAKADAADQSDEKIWLISQWDDGGRWYRYAYALEGLSLYHYDGDNTVLIAQPDTTPQTPLALNRQTFADFIRQNGITLVLTDVVDYDFMQQFAGFFSDGLAGAEEGRCGVYRVQETDRGVALVRLEETPK